MARTRVPARARGGAALKPEFFATPDKFRAWLERNHDGAEEVLVGFYKKATGKPSMTWSEAVDEALCFGWIDGKTHSLDDESYAIRFTPRRPRSNWSAVNIAKAKALIAEGRMTPAGLRAFEARADERSAVYAYEQRRNAELTREQEREFKRNARAWAWFQDQAPSYRRTAVFRVTSAKKDETQARRLAQLIDDSAAGRRIPPLSPARKR